MQPKISVIVPVYNVEKYIGSCITSLINQTYDNLEIIIVDDGSKDNSVKLCQKYDRQDKRVKYFSKINGGLSDARNFGLEKSTGEYVTFIDSDDYVREDYIERLYDTLKSTNTDISIGGFKYFHEERNIFENTTSGVTFTKVFSDTDILNLMYSFENTYVVSLITAWGKLYKKALFSDIKYPVGKNYEDEFTTYKLYLKAKKISYLNDELYFYRKRSGSIMAKPYSTENLATLEALEERLNILSKHNKDLSETRYYYLSLLSYHHYMLKKHGYAEATQIQNIFIDKYMKYAKQFTVKRRLRLFLLKNFETIFYKLNKMRGNN